MEHRHLRNLDLVHVVRQYRLMRFAVAARIHDFFEQSCDALDHRGRLRGVYRKCNIVRPSIDKRKDHRFYFIERFEFAQFIGLRDKLGDKRDISRRAANHYKLVVGSRLDGESLVFHPELCQHCAYLARLHILEVYQQGLGFAGAIYIKDGAIVVPCKIMRGSDALEELRWRDILELARKHPLHAIGHYDAKPDRSCESI